MPKYIALKHSIRGLAGALIEAEGNDIAALQLNGVIGDKPYDAADVLPKPKAHTEKAEVKAPKKKAK